MPKLIFPHAKYYIKFVLVREQEKKATNFVMEGHENMCKIYEMGHMAGSGHNPTVGEDWEAEKKIEIRDYVKTNSSFNSIKKKDILEENKYNFFNTYKHGNIDVSLIFS